MKFSNTLNWLTKPKNLWITIFTYTILTGLFIQVIFLPYIAPSWHAGNGLLRGVDGPKFHRIALELSTTIEDEGWGEWELTPSGQMVSGIAAVCYVIIYPAPWSVLPINAFLNATASVCLFLLLSKIMADRRRGLIATVPFIFFPSSFEWNAQFHNENYVVPGVILLLYGWMLITKKEEENHSVDYLVAAIAIVAIVIGSFLLGQVRIYILSGMSFLFTISSIVLIIVSIIKSITTRKYSANIIIVILAISVMYLTLNVIDSKDSLFLPTNIKGKSPNVSTSGPSNLSISELSDLSTSEPSIKKKWVNSSWLPEAIDLQLKDIAKYRRKFVRAWSDGGSSIDLNVIFRDATDMIMYVPRSFQIAFFSPFPNIWFSTGKKAAGSAMRIVSAFEMLIAYFCLLGLPLFLWQNRRQPEVWVIVFVCTSMLIVYAMIIPNQGALYRFRYPFYMPLICFGLAGLLSKFSKKTLLSPIKKQDENYS